MKQIALLSNTLGFIPVINTGLHSSICDTATKDLKAEFTTMVPGVKHNLWKQMADKVWLDDVARVWNLEGERVCANYIKLQACILEAI